MVNKREVRPWGWYESLEISALHQVKHICVYPEGKLSLQSHKHRAEHWTVIEGEAVVTLDDEKIVLKANQSIYLPLGSIHRLYNSGNIDMHLIEVQCGDYFGEDDIIRYEDIYGR
jgi:mannose-1-phosphate guanylyltransferase / mannose-6-phosphate isomerase